MYRHIRLKTFITLIHANGLSGIIISWVVFLPAVVTLTGAVYRTSINDTNEAVSVALSQRNLIIAASSHLHMSLSSEFNDKGEINHYGDSGKSTRHFNGIAIYIFSRLASPHNSSFQMLLLETSLIYTLFSYSI